MHFITDLNKTFCSTGQVGKSSTVNFTSEQTLPTRLFIWGKWVLLRKAQRHAFFRYRIKTNTEAGYYQMPD